MDAYTVHYVAGFKQVNYIPMLRVPIYFAVPQISRLAPVMEMGIMNSTRVGSRQSTSSFSLTAM